jgi:hypothetical protein
MLRSFFFMLGVLLVAGGYWLQGYLHRQSKLQPTAVTAAPERPERRPLPVVKFIPDTVFGGGPPITVEVELNAPGRLQAVFESSRSRASLDHRYLDASQQLTPGRHRFNIAVPKGVNGELAIWFDDAHVGTAGKLALKVGGKIAHRVSERLQRPLGQGYVFGVTMEIDDFSTGKVSGD